MFLGLKSGSKCAEPPAHTPSFLLSIVLVFMAHLGFLPALLALGFRV